MHHVLHFQDIKTIYFDVVSRGMKPDALMEVFDEECAWEDFWSLTISALSYVYTVWSQTYIIVQEMGILLSSCGIAQYLHDTVDLQISDPRYAPLAEE